MQALRRLSGARWHARHVLRHGWLGRALTGHVHRGYCTICEGRTLFVEEGPWLRDQYRCYYCRSIPRWRAVLHTLSVRFPAWRDLQIHESSPGGAASEKLRAAAARYTATFYWPDTPLGTLRPDGRCENLEQQTFPDNAFDLVITQDVFEHVLNPKDAFREIARTLKAGGAHVFTVPMYRRPTSVVRARQAADGTIEHLLPADYHHNPISAQGSLVVTEWGHDLPAFIHAHSGLQTETLVCRDRHLGLDGEFLEVFVSRK